MSDHAATPHFGGPRAAESLRDDAREITGHRWVGLVSGIAWLVIARGRFPCAGCGR